MQETILLVDDNKQSRGIFARRLEGSGYSVIEAENGVECLKRLNEVVPNLIILDLMMPVMDGFKVLQMVKTNAKTKDIPVLVLSGRGQPEEVQKALKLGACDFLIKMRTNPNILLEKVKSTLANVCEGVVPRYLLAVKETVFDAAMIAKEYELPPNFHCGKCGNPIVLELVPDFSHDEPWFTGHFVCSFCA